MPNPAVVHAPDLAVTGLFCSDHDGRPLLVTVLKATWEIEADGTLAPAKPEPVELAGQWWGDPGLSSLRLEPDIAWSKPSTDVVVLGHAHSRRRDRKQVDVSIAVGSSKTTLRVTGDRRWVRRLLAVVMTEPEPFETMPLTYEFAFGGWDRSAKDEARHTYEPRNPVGRGFRAKGAGFEDDVFVPNIEDPSRPMKGYHDRPEVAGTGFLAPDWQPRCDYAGTYDAAWDRDRKPALPADFDPRFFQAAHPSLVSRSPLRGDEPMRADNVTPDGSLAFDLPGKAAPAVLISRRSGSDAPVATRLDTVVLDADARRVTLHWRGMLPLREGAAEIREIVVDGAEVPW